MFSSLARYLEDGYLEQHPEITVTLPDGTLRTYRIFAARVMDASDKAYTLDLMSLKYQQEQGDLGKRIKVLRVELKKESSC